MTSPQAQIADASVADAEPHSDRLAVLVLIVLTLTAMGRLCTHDFTLWDDQGTVYQNQWLLPPTMRTLVHYWTSPAYSLYIPVTYTVWAAVAHFAQVPKDAYGISLNPWLFHGTNVLCHLLAVLVAYRILRLLNADTFAALCGALLFGVHPVQVEAVAWVSGLKDLLSGLLALVALWQYVSFAISDLKGQARVWRYLLATGAFMLAMLSKPSAMALPLAVLAIDRWGVGRPWRKVLPTALGWVFVALPLAAIARWAQDASNAPTPPPWMRPLIATDALAFYAAKLLWPLNLAIDYGRSPTAVLDHGTYLWDWIIPTAIAAFLLAGVRHRPVLLASGLIFLAGCLPVLGLTPAMFQYFSTTTDHYLYFSMFGPALALAWLLSVRPIFPLRLITAIVLTCLIALAIRQGGFWKNDTTLFAHDIEVNPQSYSGYINLGAVYDRAGDFPRAVDLYKTATRVDPEYTMSWENLAAGLRQEGKIEEAIPAMRQAVDLQIKYPNLRPNWLGDNQAMGEMLLSTAHYADAIPYLQTAADLDPQNQDLAKELAEARKRAATQPGGSQR